MLTNIYCYDDKAKAAIEDLSYDDAKILLDYYSEHEKEVFPYDKLLSSTELGTTEARSVTTDSTKESGKGKKSTKNTESSHTCLECGKSANHSITGLNGTLEWYCDQHWQEMQEMYNKITNPN
ncbi:MAG: hypothetical protein IJI25_03605 [Eubacterium sp.]|nr:hypothetical protein [Eubacterium sp.]